MRIERAGARLHTASVALARLNSPMPSSIGRLICLLACLWASSPGAFAQSDLGRTLHTFVIDHSYSMVNKTAGVTRWDFVVEKLDEWTKSLPTDGSADVVFLLFNNRVPGRRPYKNTGGWIAEFTGWSSGDVGKAADFVERIGAPREGEGTALWNALGYAMRRVDIQGGEYADCWIYLFTDGKDINSLRNPRDREFTFPKKRAGKAPLLASWRALLSRRPDTYLIEQPLGQMEPPLEPEPVNPHIYTSRPELNDLLKVRVAPSQPEYPDLLQEREVELVVQLAGTGVKRVGPDDRFRVSFEATDAAAELELDPETLPLEPGKHRVRVRAKAGDVREGVRGVLKIGFPDLERTDVIGPTEVPLDFAAAASVSISKITPSGTVRWPVHRPLSLRVQHTGDVVAWDLGDGSQATGDQVEHTYQRVGEYDVRVSASAPGRQPAEEVVKVVVIQAAVTLNQAPEMGVVVGKPVRFKADVVAARKRQFDWQVDGGVRAGGEADGSVLELSFDEPGTHEVRVRAFTADVGVLERTVQVQVGAGVSVRLSDFASSVDAGLKATFEAEVSGSFVSGRLQWAFVDASGGALGPAAAGVAPVRDGVSRWEVEVPRDLPAQVQLVAAAELSEDERGRFGSARDVVPVSVRPPGLHMKKIQPVDADVVELGSPLVFEAMWTGTKATAVDGVRWQVLADNQPVRAASTVQPSREATACGATYALDLADADDLLGKQVTVAAIPIAGGDADESRAARWEFAVRLPRRDYRIVSPSLTLGRLDYGTNLQVRLDPADYVTSVSWDWGDGVTEEASPVADLAHTYGFDDGGARRVLATVRRADGTTRQIQLRFDFVVPRLTIETTGVARLNQNLSLRVGPESLASMIQEVAWDFGAGFGEPEADLATSHMWTDRAGTVEVRARIKLRDGSERALLPVSINVNASKTVRAAPEVLGGTTHGAVELRANVTPDSDYTAIEVEVFRDGAALATVTGDVASHSIVEGEFGEYEFRFRARRVATPENPQTIVELGAIGRTYRLRRYVLAFSVLAGGGVLIYMLLRGLLWKQFARNWKLRFTTDEILQAEDLYDIDSRQLRLSRRHWKWFQWNKQVDVPVKDLVKVYGEDAADEGVSRLVESTSSLRIRAQRAGTLTSPGEQWDGPHTHSNNRDMQIFLLPAPRRDGSKEKTLYAWLEAKDWWPGYNILSVVFALVALGGWLWFAVDRCFLF